MADIAVVGSLNLDIRLKVDRIPRSGETISASGAMRSPGGKGANQAVAAARLGRSVAMVGAVGSDSGGQELRERLADEGVEVGAIAVVEDLDGQRIGTGTATILWEEPESTIVIEPGANAAVGGGFVAQRRPWFSEASAVMCQCEVPLSALEAVVVHASGLKVLNPAPAVSVPIDIRNKFDLLLPNRFELALLAGSAEVPETAEEVASLVRRLEFPGDVVVTLGGEGCLVLPRSGAPTSVAARPVRAVDTTAAGDSFCAALVDGVLSGVNLNEAAKWANQVAALTTTRHGAIESLPTREEVIGFHD